MRDHADLAAPPSLDDLKARRAALFLDFDGTLVDIAPTPDSIDVPHALGDLLRALRAGLEGRLAVVSGRSREDISEHVDLTDIPFAGSHGGARYDADGRRLGEALRDFPAEASAALQEGASELAFEFERKTHGAALHYRHAPEREEEALALAAKVAQRFALEVKRGKCVAELVWPGVDKGGAVAAFLKTQAFAGALPVFIGDDVTDEDGFAACERHGGFGILVGEPRNTRARYRLGEVEDVYSWLTG